jgi:hypothetical protein
MIHRTFKKNTNAEFVTYDNDYSKRRNDAILVDSHTRSPQVTKSVECIGQVF